MANTETLNIQILGSGCAKCKRLFEQTKEAVSALGMNIAVSYSADIQKIVELGVMSSPVLTIGGQPVIVGRAPDAAELKSIIQKYISDSPSPDA